MRNILVASVTAGFLISISAGAQISPSPTQAPAITPPGQQRAQQPPSHQQPISPMERSPQPTQVMNLPGVLVGYVYWDTTSIQYDVTSPCNGFSVSISQGTPPSGTNLAFEQFTALGTYNNNFSSIGKIGKYAVCQYAVHHLPEGKDLKVQIIASSSNFKTVVFPAIPPTANEPNRPIQIINGKCNNLPPAVPTLATLGSNWWTCGDYAYNVNFVMQPPQNIPGLTSAPGTIIVAQSQPLLPGTPSGGILNPGAVQSPQPGSLAGKDPGPMQSNQIHLPGGKDPGPVQLAGAKDPGPAQTPQSAPSVNWGDRNNQAVLGNRDVIQMLSSGLPESVIVTRIQSAKGSFDLSPAGCAALQHANASMKILNAMGDGSVSPCTGTMASPGGGKNADDLNPQPFPPHSISAPVAGTGGRISAHVARRIDTVLSAPHQSRKITNPKATLRDAEIIAVLRKQRQAADEEFAAMKLSLRPAGFQGMTGPSQTMAAVGAGGMNPTATRVQANMLPENAPSSTPSKMGTALASNFRNSLVLGCSHDPTMRIITVSGGQSPAVFTQDANYNFYTLSGCSFGDPGTNAKIYIYYQGTFREDFQIQQWSDNWIQFSLDPHLTGVDDHDNLTLVVQRGDGKQAIKNGFRFYAARDTILLPVIPQTNFSLDRFRPDNAITSSWKLIYTSGSSPSVIPNLAGLSAEVHWDISTEPDGSMTGGSDIYDFSHLHSTFVTENALMEWKDISCSDPNLSVFQSSKNDWSIDWYGSSGLQVGWQGQQCTAPPNSCGGGFFQTDCFVGPTPGQTNYGVNVWVTGPRGVDPWTGKPSS